VSVERRRLRPGLRSVRGRWSAAEVVEDARSRGMAPHVVRPAASKAELLDAVAETLDFPAWTGRNWDALADALADLSWLPTGPHVLVWPATERLREADPAAYATAVEVLHGAARASADSARPLTVLLVPGPAVD
jgi:hypothetical protein